ncbi:hypothetical protein DdX_19313 [Ditylenchus destructor]|uniref:Uncharacterized protein n=1 Tax=Ditylenchus destructor TaxID=166010 RepID=A0AAD4MI71_9BILA|nr:hypothetical protein DdX_19313 [Ditylenchus destructor]
MNRSTLLVFLCVFALSEVLLAAELGRFRAVAAMKNSSGMRHIRSTNCGPTDSQCDELCKFLKAGNGRKSLHLPHTACKCDILDKSMTKEDCVQACKILGGRDKKGLEGTQKFLTGTTVALGLIGAIATVATAGAAAPVFAPMVGAMAAGSGFLGGIVSIFSPSKESECTPPDPRIQEIKDLVEKIMPAIKELTNIVIEKFDGLQKHIDQAVAELKAAIDQTQAVIFQSDWRTNVVVPMEQLRMFAGNILSANMTNARGDVVSMANVCKSPQGNPLVIASHIWGMYGDGCKKKAGETRKVEGPFCDINSPHYAGPCPEIESLCYSELFIRSSGHNHAAASQLFNIVAGTLLELTTYHTMCVNFTYDDPQVVASQNNAFINETNKTLDQMQKIIIAETERYWPEPAEKYIASFMGGPSAEENSQAAYNALNGRYSWYHHQLFLVRKKDRGELAFAAQAYELPMVIEETEQHKNVNDELFVIRYRVAADWELPDKHGHYLNYIEWLKKQVPHDAGCYEAGADSDTVKGCLIVATAKNGDVGKLNKTLAEYADGEIHGGRNHGFIHVETYGVGLDVYKYGQCDEQVCYNVIADIDAVIHYM